MPQGSVLGPLLLLVYKNDLLNSSSKLNFYLFAEDTNIYFESDNQDYLQKELKQVKKWLDANKLALNIERTNFVIFHSLQNSLITNPSIKIGNQHARQAIHVKSLGLLLNEHLC